MHDLYSELANIEAHPVAKKLDARIKVVCAIIVLFEILVLTRWHIAALVFVSCLVLALFCRVPMKLYLQRLIYPTSMIVLVSVLQALTPNSMTTAVALLPPLSINLEGLQFGLALFTKCLAAVAVLNLLTCTSTTLEILSALRWLRTPSALLDLALLTLRCVFLLWEEAQRVHRAQESRCGYSKALGLLGRLRNYGVLFGVLFVRSYERASTIGRAMVARGYSGRRELFALPMKPLSINQVIYGLGLSLPLALLVVVERFMEL